MKAPAPNAAGAGFVALTCGQKGASVARVPVLADVEDNKCLIIWSFLDAFLGGVLPARLRLSHGVGGAIQHL